MLFHICYESNVVGRRDACPECVAKILNDSVGVFFEIPEVAHFHIGDSGNVSVEFGP